ncbi:hypothetical protein GCM10027048_19830 [Hymenobacter coalescens]
MLKSYARCGRGWLLLLLLLLPGLSGRAQQTDKKIVLQAFWWDYWNTNYPAGWANYLADLAPRLKAMGIDAVWIPPVSKNKDAISNVGYSPFDHYDLGDKYQKGATTTRVGTKDELLRMIAVLHANGIEVVQDVVLNHADGAGGTNGYGGYDPDPYSTQSNAGYKSFRYASYATPAPETEPSPAAAHESSIAAEYLTRRGRWPKNYANFHPHFGHNSTSGALAEPMFGPDFCYGDDGAGNGYGGLSSAVLAQYPAAYNPAQSNDYSRNEARSWLLWLKKQTGVDGFRWDAVKHFSYAAQQDWSYNLKYLNGWANGGQAMFNVGEYVGGKAELDGYVNDVNARNGGSEFMLGTFDFGLREGLYGLVTGSGNFDVGSLPSRQQDRRVAQYGSGTSAVYVHRTVPFVNNHDTFRPQLSATGTYTGWNTGSELAPHIDPFEPRLSAAYAVALAVDGAPQIFFEDLFNVGGTGKRFSHLPTSATDLPVRPDLENLIWCHQNLRFKDGAYRVRWQAQDHLVIERSARALVGINDSWDQWQNHTVETDFAAGTRLKDYSGANGNDVKTVFTGGDGKRYVNINTPPCNGSAAQGRRGYSVWGPENLGAAYAPPRSVRTEQEWEMADDLGDRNCQSLGQGGRLPDYSTNTRVVGKIFVRSGQAVNYELYPELPNTGRQLTLSLHDAQGLRLHAADGAAALIGSYTPAATGWLTLKVRNAAATYTGQRCFVKASYVAPASLDARATPAAPAVAVWSGNDLTADPTNCRNWEGGLLPSASVDVRIPAGSMVMPALGTGSLQARHLTVEAGATLAVAAGATLRLSGNLSNAGTLAAAGTVELAGSSRQTLEGPGTLSFNHLTINNAADVRLLSSAIVTGTLAFTTGRLLLDNQSLTLTATATLAGTDAARYVVTNDAPTGGALLRPAAAGATLLYPVGTAASYTPLTLQNTGSTAADVAVRVFGGTLQNGTSGAPHAQAAAFVGRTWQVTPSGPLTGTLTLQWNAADESASFDRSRATVLQYNGVSWGSWSSTAAVSGTGPFTATAAGVNSFSSFGVGTGGAVLPVSLLGFRAERRGPRTVQLRWATAQEKNNDRFEVEKSTDGHRFGRVGVVSGHGTTTRAQAYVFADAEAPVAAYYRLRQVDSDGTATYSDVQYVAAADAALALFPNPTTGEVHLTGLPEHAPVRLALRSATGRDIYRSSETMPAAAAQQQLSTALRRAAPGLYVLTVDLDGHLRQLKVLKQ